MRSALYFPHTVIRTRKRGERLLKRALLLWDELEYIVPYEGYEPHYEDRVYKAALELVGRPRVPTDNEKQQVHEQIEELITRPNTPDVFFYKDRGEPYQVHAEKLLPNTWRLLEERGAVGSSAQERYALRKQAGLLIMAMLADVCAGDECSRVTDRGKAYATLASLLSDRTSQQLHEDEHLDRVVTTSVPLLNLDKLSLEQLVAFRRKEGLAGGHKVRALRHRYLKSIEDYLNDLKADSALTEGGVRRKERQFVEDMQDDLAHLKDELKYEQVNTLLSKELVFAFIASAAAGVAALGLPFIVPGIVSGSESLSVPAGLVSIGGLLLAGNKYEQRRANVLRSHPTAYVFQLPRRSNALWRSLVRRA